MCLRDFVLRDFEIEPKVQLLQVSNFFTLFHFVAFIAFHFLLLPGIYFLSLHIAEEKMEDSIQVP